MGTRLGSDLGTLCFSDSGLNSSFMYVHPQERVTMPEPKRLKMSQERKARPSSSKQKLMGLVKRKDPQPPCMDPQLEPRLSATARDRDTSQEHLVSGSEVGEEAVGDSVAQEAGQKSPTASSSMAEASDPISQGPNQTSESVLGGAAVCGSLGLLGTYSDSEDSD